MLNLVLLTNQKMAQILFPNNTSFNDEKVVKYLMKKSSINDDKNQCYSREPHWELSKKEVKLDPLRGIEPRKNHYGKSTLSSRTALRQYIHNYESTRTKSCPCVGSRTPRKVKN